EENHPLAEMMTEIPQETLEENHPLAEMMTEIPQETLEENHLLTEMMIGISQETLKRKEVLRTIKKIAEEKRVMNDLFLKKALLIKQQNALFELKLESI
ncbi:MAG: hypothetical protein K1060chlam4_01109, partial [Candidatus Anoxychlamydiales bacterium]|nr:hypothetical protein [Candidatus Anoxychlamydiales bacterium]